MENNFEDKINEVFNHPPEFPVDDAAWASISQRLEVPPPSNQTSLTKWIWLPVAFCMLGLASVAGYYFSQYQNVSNQLAQIDKNNSQFNTIQYDTIYQKQVTIVYDTIYQKTLIQKNNNTISNHSNTFSNKIKSNSLLIKKSPLATFHKTHSSQIQKNLFDTPPYSQNVSIQNRWKEYHLEKTNATNKEELITNVALSKLNSTNIEYLSSLSNPHLETLNDLDFLEIKFKNKKWKHRLQTMQPDRFALGLHSGIGYNFGFDFSNSDQNNYTYGLEAELGFGDRLSWVIGIDYQVHDLKLDHDDNIPFDLSLYPEIVPQDMTDELNAIKNEVISINIPIGFKYSFLSWKKIQPYLGFGFVSRKIIATKGMFKFEQTIGNGEYEVIEEDFLLTEFQWRNLWGNIGAKFQVYRQWHFFVEGKYQFNLPQQDVSRLEQIKLLSGNAGLKYQF